MWQTQGMAGTGIANFTFNAAGVTVDAKVELPDRAVTVEEMLPVLHGVGGILVQIATAGAEAEGKQISCRAGCGACCRQLVPLSEHEARFIADMVLNMEEPRRTTLLLRFRDAVKRVEEAGLRPHIENIHMIEDRKELTRVGMDYFHLGVPCPFLEEESCSIHPVRPMACREYLVVSDPEHCKHPEERKTEGILLPGSPATALSAFGDGDGEGRYMTIPLILSLQFAAANPAPPAKVHASDMLKHFLESMQRQVRKTEEERARNQDDQEDEAPEDVD